jgi:hypothetical protein
MEAQSCNMQQRAEEAEWAEVVAVEMSCRRGREKRGGVVVQTGRWIGEVKVCF